MIRLDSSIFNVEFDGVDCELVNFNGVAVWRRPDGILISYDGKLISRDSVLVGYSEAEALPYEPLSYIESSGVQYIDTGINATTLTQIDMEFEMLSLGSDGQSLFGTYIGSSVRLYLRVTNALTAYYVGSTNYGSSSIVLTANTRYRTTKTNSAITLSEVDGATLLSKSVSIASATVLPYGIGLFGSLKEDGVGSPASMRLYECELRDENDTLLRSFIPCRRISDGEICLYDSVSGEFFTNQGSGSFVAGE